MLSRANVFNADWRTRQRGEQWLRSRKRANRVYPRRYISIAFYGTVEEWRIDDGSFVKLREVSLGYNFGNLGKVRTLD